jgi:hypothetical protein
MHLALVLHELATNARKHGALSVPYGRLSVTWQMRTNGCSSLLLSWKESNGPKVSAPSAHGFGRTLIEQTVRAHGGEASIEYRTDGLTCEIKLPLPERRDLLAPMRRRRKRRGHLRCSQRRANAVRCMASGSSSSRTSRWWRWTWNRP